MIKRKSMTSKVKKRIKAKIRFDEECRRLFVNPVCSVCGIRQHIHVNEKAPWEKLDPTKYKCILCKAGIKPIKQENEKVKNTKRSTTIVSVIKKCLIEGNESIDKIHKELISIFPEKDTEKLKRGIKGYIKYLKNKGEI